MFTVGMDVDSRAYFTAATCAISLFISLGVITPPLFFPNKNFLKNYSDSYNQLTLWNKPLGFSSMTRIGKLSNIERNNIQLTPRARSILIGLILSDG